MLNFVVCEDQMLRACFTLHVHLSLFPLAKAWYGVLLSGQECFETGMHSM